MSIATFNTGDNPHLLDHIAPLAYILKAPLILNDPALLPLATKYYPQVSIELKTNLNKELKELTSKYDTFIECKYWNPELRWMLRHLYQAKTKLIFCPHGQSDKGFEAPLLAPYTTQDGVLLYGPLMKLMLQKLKLWEQLPPHAMIGNYRKTFYETFSAFYDPLIEKDVFSRFAKKQPTLLYAPTWRDADQATTFFTHLEPLLKALPAHWNLLVKPHPLLKRKTPELFYQQNFLEKSNVLFLKELPLVYPLLARVNAVLSDASSISYDALSFPCSLLFFQKKQTPIYQCGIEVTPETLFPLLEKELPLSKQRKKLYAVAFEKTLSFEEIRNRCHPLFQRG